MNASDPETLHVLIATPAGGEGQGGIDRLMACVRTELARSGRRDVVVRFGSTRGAGTILLAPFFLLSFCVMMAWLRLTARLDVVHINVSSYGSTYRKMVVAGLSRVLRVPYVLHLHGADYRSFWSGAGPVLSRLIGALYIQAGMVLALGRVWRAFIQEKAPRAKVSVLPNACPSSKTVDRDRGGLVHILFLGRLDLRKGVPQLVEALGAMKDLPGWRATIAGDGLVDETRQHVQALGLKDRVQIPGWAGPEKVEALIGEADLLVLPSFDENLPMSVIEGMAAGLAIVATPVGAVEDIVVDGDTGLLVPPGDAGALAHALGRLVRDDALRNRLGQAGLALHRERLDIVPYVSRLVDIWRAAAQRGCDER